MEATEPLEQLRAAATIYNGKTYEGVTHPSIMVEIEDANPNVRYADCVEGFVTTKGRFLSRTEAKKLADEQGLVGPMRPGDSTKELWTEYLPYDIFKPKGGGKDENTKAA